MDRRGRGSDVRIRYGGTISHQQNRAMVEQFGLKLVAVTSTTVTGTALISFVDHHQYN